jgi:hypothetical protein
MMKKNSPPGYGASRSLVAVVVSCLLISFLVMPAGASMYKENGGLWDRIVKPAIEEHLVLPEPPYITDNPANRGTYTGLCPIGTGGAPQLRDTGLSTGALCRGACGMDCPAERCEPVLDEHIPVDGGVCTYKHTVICLSHEGCRNHDACYDYCSEKSGDSSVLFGHCHGLCNSRCYDEYGIYTCSKWAALPGSFVTALGWIQDSVATPLAGKSLVFSDAPVFTPENTDAVCDYSNPGNVICY